MNTTSYSDLVEAAIQDVEDLVPWAEVNCNALQWDPLDEAVRRGLSCPVDEDYALAAVPLLKFANGRRAIPLVGAVIAPPVPKASWTWKRCDVYGTTMREPSTLWIPCGGSVVQVTMRNGAREILQDLTRGSLVWSYSPHEDAEWTRRKQQAWD